MSEKSVNPLVIVGIADPVRRNEICRDLEEEGFRTERCPDGAAVFRLISRRDPVALVLDLSLNPPDIDLVSFSLERHPALQVIVLYPPHRWEQGLESLRRGAASLLPDGCRSSDIALVLKRAVSRVVSQQTLDTYEQNLFESLAGGSEGMRRVVHLIRKVAPTDSTVLLLGESGTGKEIVAQTLHRLSRRRNRPFVAVNCAALPEGLLESELFGHVKGAFTGADRDKRGLFAEADGGTLFLDEVGDMALATQAKLLRALQNGEIRQVGATAPQKVNVRVIAATNVDLARAVAEKRFREDLYYRLNVFQIRIPPLRERLDALPALVRHFIQLANRRFDRNVQGIDEEAMACLRRYPFPGNIRELESIVAHGVIMADQPLIRAQDLPDAVRRGAAIYPALEYHETRQEVEPLEKVEARAIQRALEHFGGNQSLAAKALGISRSTLWRKLREYGLGGNVPVPDEETGSTQKEPIRRLTGGSV